MKLSTGKVKFPIEFDNGDVEYIYFNPSDEKLAHRLMNFGSGIEKRKKEIDLEKYKSAFSGDNNFTINSIDDFENLSEDELGKLCEASEAIRSLENEYQKQVCDELDEIFEDDISGKVFKYVAPLQYVERYDKPGEYEPYVMQFVRALEIEIRKHSNKVNSAMQKHIGKYQKK